VLALCLAPELGLNQAEASIHYAPLVSKPLSAVDYTRGQGAESSR
jgi:hypothetical protein